MTKAVVEATTESPSDAALAEAVRGGDIAAYGVLYARHLQAARRVAMSFGLNGAERDDLIAEGFTRVLRILRAGGGPNEDFRPYLLTTMRNAVISWRRRDSSISLVADVPDIAPSSGYDDQMGTRIDAALAGEAFASLPERWRTVLWRTEVEGESPAQIAKRLGMTPNGVAALAYRAREGLRKAYLTQYVPAVEQRACRGIAGQLVGWVRHDGSGVKSRRIKAHLDHCPRCREVVASLRQLNQELHGSAAPLLLVTPILAAHYATSSGTFLGGVGLSAMSWLTAAKTLIAGTAVLSTAAMGATASAPAPAPPPAVSTVSEPAEQRLPPRTPAPAEPLAVLPPETPQPVPSPVPTATTPEKKAAKSSKTPPAANADEAAEAPKATKAPKAPKEKAPKEAKPPKKPKKPKDGPKPR